jgi:hypothetical protein
MDQTLDKVKTAMRIVTSDFDEELTDLISAGLADLGIAGVDGELAVITNSLVRQAVITYCKMHFGEPDEYERLKTSYDEQKAQLSMHTGYTVWGLNG